jgi:hypothetical protein
MSGAAGKAEEEEEEEEEAEAETTMTRHEISVAENYAFVRALNVTKALRLLEKVALPSLTGKSVLMSRKYKSDSKVLMLASASTPESVDAFLSSPFHLFDRPGLIPKPQRKVFLLLLKLPSA